MLGYENSIKGGIVRVICHYVEVNNKYMINYETKKLHTLHILI